MLHYFISAVRFRSITYFSAVNPVISLGGMLDERKSDIYALLPGSHVPKTVISKKSEDYHSAFESSGLKYPVILKPNVGFKGHLVVKVDRVDELDNYFKKIDDREILIQEFIDLEREYSIMYYRMPATGRSGISSLIEKKYPYVIADGIRTTKELIENFDNPFLKKEWVFLKMKDKLDEIPVKGEKIVLDSIGNYSRGAKFFSLNENIDDRMVQATDHFFKRLKGLNFFRMDIKANSLEAYNSGQFKILEINGAKSEPLHIYDPKYSFPRISRDIGRHWKLIDAIVKDTQSNDYKFPSFKSGWQSFKTIKKMMK